MSPSDDRSGATSDGRKEATDWQAVDRLFTVALELEPARRGAFLDEACAGDETLRRRVEELLDAERTSAGAFENVAAAAGDVLAEAIDSVADEHVIGLRAGELIGPWRIERLLGGGGMAVVYQAVRDAGDWRQRAALKLLRHGVETRADVLRFIAERQILSTLQHPNIARLLDGGTTEDGLPYLVAEYVDGERITDYCDTRRLGVEARLDLFLQVVDAVHYAHRQLVVHRDLKPANVLVDADGRVRLLDFGIAKLLEPLPGQESGALTRTGWAPMTPEYAAPEQRRAGVITTATDVYQLGVLLHELLVGTRPAAAGNEATALGPRPSREARRLGDDAASVRMPCDARALERRLRGDLDAIVHQALREEPEQRYASAAALAEDVRNHLRGRMVAARPERALDVVRRLARRNPIAAWAAAAAVALLVAWAASTQFYARELAAQRDVAIREADRATRVKNLLLDLFRRADPIEADAIGGREATIWDSLAASERQARVELADEPLILEELQSTLAALYDKAARAEDARRLLTEVLAAQQRRGAEARAATAVTLADLGRLDAELGDLDAANTHLQQALQIVADLGPEDAATSVSVLLDAAHHDVDYGTPQDALVRFDQARDTLARRALDDSNAQVEIFFGRGNALRALGRLEEARESVGDALRIAEQSFGPEHARLAGVLTALGSLERELNHPVDAARLHRRALEILLRDYGETYAGTLAARNNLALASGAAGEYGTEQEQLRALVDARRELLGDEHVDVGYTLQNLGASLVKSGDYTAALPVLAEARAVLDSALPRSNPRRAFPLLSEAAARLALGEGAAAEAAAAPAIGMLEQALPPGHFATAIGRCLLGEALLQQGRRDDARALIEESLPVIETAGPSQAFYLARCQGASRGLITNEKVGG